jgi:hypothetical protein
LGNRRCEFYGIAVVWFYHDSSATPPARFL